MTRSGVRRCHIHTWHADEGKVIKSLRHNGLLWKEKLPVPQNPSRRVVVNVPIATEALDPLESHLRSSLCRV